MTDLWKAVSFAALTLALTACQRDDMEKPLVISGKVFIFNYRVAQATAVITLARNGALPDESYVETSFENPAGGAPHLTRSRIFPFWKKVTVESPPMRCVAKDRPYAVAIRIVDADGRELQSIETTIVSSLDQSILPSKPLVVGPVYTRNPEVFKADGSTDYAPDLSCPK